MFRIAMPPVRRRKKKGEGEGTTGRGEEEGSQEEEDVDGEDEEEEEESSPQQATPTSPSSVPQALTPGSLPGKAAFMLSDANS